MVADASAGPGGPLSHAPERILWDVVDEHLDEAEYLVDEVEAALDSPLYDVAAIARGPEGRLLAHLDGLEVGGPTTAERALLPVLDGDAEPARVTAAALALLGARAAPYGPRLVERLAELPAEARDGLVRALGMADRPDLEPRLHDALRRDAAPRAAVLSVLARRGADPGASLDPCVTDEDPEVRLAAIEAARFGSRRFQGWAESIAVASEGPLRKAAIATALVLGSRQAWELVGALAFSADAPDRDAMAWLAMFGDQRQTQRIIDALEHEGLRAPALYALGFSGRRIAAEACLRWLGDPDVGPLAGEAFGAITGLPRDDDRYVIDPVPADEAPADEALPPLEEDLEADLSATPEDDLPVPNPETIAAYWAEIRPRLSAEGRHLGGLPVDQGSLVTGLERQPARRRHALAFELLVRSHGQARIPTRMLVGAQARALAVLGAPPRIDGNRAFGHF